MKVTLYLLIRSSLKFSDFVLGTIRIFSVFFKKVGILAIQRYFPESYAILSERVTYSPQNATTFSLKRGPKKQVSI